MNAAPTAAPRARWWTRSPAPDLETRLPPSTAAALMMSSTAATIPTAFSRMITGTCGGSGTAFFHSFPKYAQLYVQCRVEKASFKMYYLL